MFTADEIQGLNDVEMQVYQYVVANKSTVPYMRIRELASACFVSPTTVMRFCKKMGCDGFTEFKWRVKAELGQEKTSILPEDITEILSFFEELEGGKYEKLMNQAAALIAASQRVLLVGIGNSGSIGQYGARYFSNIGKFSTFISDPFYPVNLISAGSTTAIILSISGETPEIISIMDQMKRSGCRIISLTAKESCTVAKLADVNLPLRLSIHRDESNLDFTTQVPTVYLLEALGRKVRNRLLED